MNFRRFEPRDAEFCFKVRTSAFIQKFYGELTPAEVAAGVNSYLPADFIRLSERWPFFIVEDNNLQLGFFTLKRVDVRSAELALIYLDLKNLGKGIGKSCMRFIEKWLVSNWPKVEKLLVDTIIPEYNGSFYRKLGFIPDRQVFCNFSGKKIKALRLHKQINPEN